MVYHPEGLGQGIADLGMIAKIIVGVISDSSPGRAAGGTYFTSACSYPHAPVRFAPCRVMRGDAQRLALSSGPPTASATTASMIVVIGYVTNVQIAISPMTHITARPD